MDELRAGARVEVDGQRPGVVGREVARWELTDYPTGELEAEGRLYEVTLDDGEVLPAVAERRLAALD